MKKPNIFSILGMMNQGDPIAILKELGGYYECPKNKEGKRLGLMVGYAGKYKNKDGSEKQYVGDIYCNFAKAESYPEVLDHFADFFRAQFELNNLPVAEIDAFCAAPMGGLAFGTILSKNYGKRYTYPEKKITALKTEHSREESKLVFDRHEIYQGERVVIVEDVSNNFSTTREMVTLIESSGAKVTGIVSILNRSTTTDNIEETAGNYFYILPDGRKLPVISLARKPIPQFRQDADPEITGLIAAGSVVWKPKNEWARLMETMPA